MKKISLPKFFKDFHDVKTYDQMEDLIKSLREDSKAKYEKAWFEAGHQARKTGINHAVFLKEKRNDLGKYSYKFEVHSIAGLDQEFLGAFMERIGGYILIRGTIVLR